LPKSQLPMSSSVKTEEVSKPGLLLQGKVPWYAACRDCNSFPRGFSVSPASDGGSSILINIMYGDTHQWLTKSWFHRKNRNIIGLRLYAYRTITPNPDVAASRTNSSKFLLRTGVLAHCGNESLSLWLFFRYTKTLHVCSYCRY
jgi:hypothetical protein